MTSYAEIFKRALSTIDDPSLVQWPEEDLSMELYNWLQKAIAKLPKLRNETAQRDGFEFDNLEGTGFANDLSDVTKEVLSLGMKREWLAPQISSTTLTWQRYSKKEGYSQKEHLVGLMELDNKIKQEIERLLRDDTYVDNDYFD